MLVGGGGERHCLVNRANGVVQRGLRHSQLPLAGARLNMPDWLCSPPRYLSKIEANDGLARFGGVWQGGRAPFSERSCSPIALVQRGTHPVILLIFTYSTGLEEACMDLFPVQLQLEQPYIAGFGVLKGISAVDNSESHWEAGAAWEVSCTLICERK